MPGRATSRSPSRSAAIKGVFAIAGSFVAPYPPGGMRIRTTSVRIDGKGRATVDWTCSTGAWPPSRKGDPYALPADLAGARDQFLLVTQTAFVYRPATLAAFTGDIELTGRHIFSSRYSVSLVSSGC